jgi:hypothetical protein
MLLKNTLMLCHVEFPGNDLMAAILSLFTETLIYGLTIIAGVVFML